MRPIASFLRTLDSPLGPSSPCFHSHNGNADSVQRSRSLLYPTSNEKHGLRTRLTRLPPRLIGASHPPHRISRPPQYIVRQVRYAASLGISWQPRPHSTNSCDTPPLLTLTRPLPSLMLPCPSQPAFSSIDLQDGPDRRCRRHRRR